MAKPESGSAELEAALAEIERLREINRKLVASHNALLIAVARSEDDAEALRDLFGPKGDVEAELREVSRDFAGAHVNADVVLAAIRRRLAGARG
jgi:hypothetical protein